MQLWFRQTQTFQQSPPQRWQERNERFSISSRSINSPLPFLCIILIKLILNTDESGGPKVDVSLFSRHDGLQSFKHSQPRFAESRIRRSNTCAQNQNGLEQRAFRRDGRYRSIPPLSNRAWRPRTLDHHHPETCRCFRLHIRGVAGRSGRARSPLCL